MSLILDALNRSRTEQGAVPNIETQHSHAAEPGDVRRWPVLLALAVALLVIVILLVERITTEKPTQPAAVVGEQAPVVVPPESTTSESMSISGEATGTVPVAASRQQVSSAPPPKVSSRDTGVLTAATQPAARSEVSALYAQQEQPAAEPDPTPKPVARSTTPTPALSVEPEPRMAEQEVNIEAMVRQAEAELENARLEEHPAPFLESLSQQVKDTIPTLYYQRHDYSGKPGRSRVTLNGNQLAKGGKVVGVRVDEILADSTVLSYQGTTFRLRALNSWVNL
ncbi:hypothetical protein A3709_00825 [Halioglobus sp. HI00S01]|uniref:general secretion pathway protein GspB n=1 Tax=Halioglobus sp. HI00S01 TaxID=1822214 RepID=UPI0007C40607|nr:general secretion pathway protein GspB [Halioglobus sp. HI00S01]KZX60642.1 hypothetical protein A3709_00825 [Halioglobus sp. HI00S01]